MLRCLSSEQFEELLTGQMEPVTQELVEAHLGACGRCRQTFVALTEVGDADDWRAAGQAPAILAAEDEALLTELKDPRMAELPPEGRAGMAIDASDWLKEVSINGHRPGRLEFKHGPPPRLPDVPGFEILAELGRGGMGVVYKARQIAYDRPVALKMILAGSQASPEDLGRFHDEAEAIARLRHPHIVQIFEVGQAEGRLYFVLEFVEGGTLADRIRGGPLPARPAAQLLEALARAMHYAHERGIVHRDLKPANVLLHGRKAFLDIPEEADRRPNEWDFRRYMPKITDFGLAKMLDRSTGRTASGDVVGTPSYMAPEQAQGKPHPISAATDIYSLGAILYEMLTGKPPFLGPTPMDTLFQVHTQEPVPPRKLVRDVPPGLETICLKCLRKDPAQRYVNAEDLAEDLRLFVEGQPIQARATHPIKQGWRELRRKTGTTAFALLVLLLAAVAGGAITYQWWLGKARVVQATAAHRDVALLRLRGALERCERGDASRGVAELGELAFEAEADPALADLRDPVRRNLAAWGRQTSTLRAMLPGVAAFAAAADGSVLTVAGQDKSLRRWLVAEGKFATESAVLPGAATAVSADAKGDRLAVVDAGMIRWDSWANFPKGRVLPDPEQAVRVAATSPDGKSILVATANGKLRWWDRGQTVSKRELPAMPATTIAWHPGGKSALVGCADGRVVLLKLDGQGSISQEWKHKAAVTGVAWAGDGALAVAACADGFVFLRPALDGQVLAAFPAHAAGPVALAASQDGRGLLTGGVDHTAKLWGTDGRLLALLPHAGAVVGVAMTERGVATRDDRGTLRFWDAPAGPDLVIGFGGARPISKPAVSVDGQFVYALVGQGAPQIQCWDLTKGGREMWLPDQGRPPLLPLCIGPQGRIILARMPDGKEVEVTSFADRRWVPGPKHEGPVRVALLRPDGPEVLTWDEAGNALVWNGETSQPLGGPVRFPQPPRGFALSADGTLVAVAGEGKEAPGVVRVHRLDDKAEPAGAPLAHVEAVVEVAFEADGKTLRTLDAQHTVRRWDYATGQVRDEPRLSDDLRLVALTPEADRFLAIGKDSTLHLNNGSAESVPLSTPAGVEFRCAAFSTDKTMLLTGWADSVRLYDVATGLPLGPPMPLPLPPLAGAAFSSGGRVIAWSATALLGWRIPAAEPGDLRKATRAKTGLARQLDGSFRNLDAREWQQLRDEPRPGPHER
ncbi:MAG: WD40 repeat domain-containing serine/threonine protein kinase [Gemmataceae bacterium]